MALPTDWIFSASSSGIEISNSSSNSITSSTVSSESAPRSLMNEVSRVILSGVVPIWSQTILITRSSIEGLVTSHSLELESLGGMGFTLGKSDDAERVPRRATEAPGSSQAEAPVDDEGLAGDVG